MNRFRGLLGPQNGSDLPSALGLVLSAIMREKIFAPLWAIQDILDWLSQFDPKIWPPNTTPMILLATLSMFPLFEGDMFVMMIWRRWDYAVLMIIILMLVCGDDDWVGLVPRFCLI